MTRKQWLNNLYAEALQELQDFDKFQSFLEYKSRLYKYDFANALLLWKQIPNATMVADLEVWKQFERRVPKGTKSSFILDFKNADTKTVFDISQTYAVKEVSIQQWEYDDEKSDYVRQELVKEHETLNGREDSIGQLIQELAITKSIMIASQIGKEIDSLEISEELKGKIKNASLVVMGYGTNVVLSNRIGYEMKGFKVEKVKESLSYLAQDKQIWDSVGRSISKISRVILNGIERSVKEYDKQKNIHRQREWNGVHRGGRWDVSSEHRSVRGNGEISHNRDGMELEELHKSESSGEISRIATQTGVAEKDVRSRAGSIGDGTENRERIPGKESVQSGGLPSERGELADGEELRQGNSRERVSISLSLKDLEQILIERRGLLENGKYRIYEFFLKNESEKARAEFLKKEFGIGGYTFHREQDGDWHISYDAKGISFGRNLEKKTFSWKEVEKTISSLIQEHRFFTIKDHNNYPDYRQKQVLKRLERDEAYWDYENNRNGLFLFGKEYEISSIKDDSILVLRESKYPLNTLEIRKIDFEKEAIKNCQNDEKWITEEKVLLQNNHEVKAWVRVLFSESADIPEQSLFPFSVSNALFEKLDRQKREERETKEYEGSWYDKTKFCLTAKLEDGSIAEITERQDFGDGYGSLYNFLSYANLPPEIMLVLNEELKRDTEKEIKELKDEIKVLENIVVPTGDEQKVDDILSGAGIGEKKKFQWNYEAIELLKNLEKEDREPVFEERQRLKLFLGWGGLSGVFDESKKVWEKERESLKELLTEQEYEEARASTPNSHYTPDFVIDEIQNYLSNYDIKTILEPSAGTGRFLKNTEKMKYTAIELDSIPARIMKKLYSQADVMIGGYEDMELADNSFDAVIGNVPFGNYGLFDKRYEKENFLIHDYFFAKSLDKVKDNGLIVLVTGKGTMDKENDAVRKYISKRAELLGAIRLPSSSFSRIANTDVSADILFLRKRSQKSSNENEWTGLGYTEDKVPVNEYYLKHPEHMLGKMKFDHRFFGENSKYTNCFIEESADIPSMLKNAFESIPVFVQDKETLAEQKNIVGFDKDIEIFTYAVFDKKAYYRNSETVSEVPNLDEKQVKAIDSMIGIRNHILLMLKEQKEGCSEERLIELQSTLQKKYDDFVRENGEISESKNQTLFERDRYSPFLFSLEQQDKNGQRIYSHLFSQRVIKPAKIITHTDSPEDALLVCLNEKGKVNLPYMRSLLGENWEDKDIVQKLNGKIMFNPGASEYETAEEYLSGNVREKLKYVEILLEQDLPEELRNTLEYNRKALKEVMPVDLVASEIEVRIGTTWIEIKDYESFLFETLKTPYYLRNERIGIEYNPYNGKYFIRNKKINKSNFIAYSTFGTEKKNAYEIMETTLNLNDVKVYKKEIDENGDENRVIDTKETILLKEKQNLLRQEFKDWIWKDEERRIKYEKYYNEKFNNIALRQYNGDFLTFPDMNPSVILHQHQRQAIARCLTSGRNTLFAHAVGAGKTYEMIASCMEGKRIGLWEKPLFVVPNHLTQQTGIEFLHLYPGANILVATEKDFNKDNRELFFAKMATGNFDAIIIGQTQLVKIGLSKEREISSIKKEISEVTEAIKNNKDYDSESWTTKEMETFKKKLEEKLKKLTQATEKTNLLTFEDLKIDQMFIDEAHDYKSLQINTKMNNVAGINDRQSQRAFDLYLKVGYLKDYYLKKEGKERGVVFATATPISNSMAELYIMQKYLQSDTLKEKGINCFDDWASNFGETTTSLELAPEGKGFRLKTRFAKFVNLPDLLTMFQEVADIKTDRMLNLPKPKANYHTEDIEPLEFTKLKVMEYADRAEKIRSGKVKQKVDNMLKITNEGRALGVDPRLLYTNALERFDETDRETKLDRVAENVYRIYEETTKSKSIQIIFSDIGVPAEKGEEKFTAYDYVKEELIKKGIPQDEICFIHDAEKSKEKQKLFNTLKSGEKRIIFGSTKKMGTGVNIQDKAIAMHHIDCPWKSSDIEQREGRIIRPGNENKTVEIYRYVTKNTFDGYLWQIVEQKQRFIDQVMNNRLVSRVAEDVDDRALTYAEVKAIATGNPIISEKIELDIQVAKLESLKSSFLKQKNQHSILLEQLPKRIEKADNYLANLRKDIELSNPDEEKFSIQFENEVFNDRGKASKKLDELYLKYLQKDKFKAGIEAVEIGNYHGFSIFMKRTNRAEIELIAKANQEYSVSSESVLGVLTKLGNKMSKSQFEKEISEATIRKEELLQNKEELTLQQGKEFSHEEELKKAKIRVKEIEDILNVDDLVYSEDDEVMVENECEEEMEM